MLKKIGLGILGLVVIILIGFGTFLVFRTDHHKTEEEAREVAMLPDSKFTVWKDNFDVHYIEAGEGESILLIHGLGGSLHDFKALFNLLKEDFHVVAVDLPGFGLSDAPDMSVYENPNYIGEYKDFFEFFLAEAQLDTFHVIGNSMGGWMTWEVTADIQDRVQSMTLLAPAGYEMVTITENATGWLKSIPAQILFAKGLSMDMSKINISACYADPSKVIEDDILIRNYMTNKTNNFDWLKELGNSGQMADTTKIPAIQVPSLVIWGTEDVVIPVHHADYFEADLPNAKVKIYENCGHVPQMEFTDKVYQDWLELYNSL